jgi:hypothetical protein
MNAVRARLTTSTATAEARAWGFSTPTWTSSKNADTHAEVVQVGPDKAQQHQFHQGVADHGLEGGEAFRRGQGKLQQIDQ